MQIIYPTGPILNIKSMGAFFWGGNILKKRAFSLLEPPKQMPFSTISNENIFLKTKGGRLGAIVAPNKGRGWGWGRTFRKLSH